MGKSNWCVTESDESDGSFLKIPFTYSIVTNLDAEHLDFYKNINNLKKSFLKFFEKIPSVGKGFICSDDHNLKKVLKKSAVSIVGHYEGLCHVFVDKEADLNTAI